MNEQPEIKGDLMKIRRDTVFVSSVLFTIALLWLVPPSFESISLRQTAAFGFVSLALVLIGLIVTWAGYVKKVRWTWFVMFVIVWGWAFPDLVYPDVVHPLYRGAIVITSFSGMIRAAFGGPGVPRDFVHEMGIFVLMVIALVLPMKSFFWSGERRATDHSRQ